MKNESWFTSMVLVKFLGITDKQSMRNFIIWIVSSLVFLGIIEYNLNKSTEKSFSLEGAYEECYKEEYRNRIALQKIISKYPLQNIAAGEKVVNVMCKEKKVNKDLVLSHSITKVPIEYMDIIRYLLLPEPRDGWKILTHYWRRGVLRPYW